MLELLTKSLTKIQCLSLIARIVPMLCMLFSPQLSLLAAGIINGGSLTFLVATTRFCNVVYVKYFHGTKVILEVIKQFLGFICATYTKEQSCFQCFSSKKKMPAKNKQQKNGFYFYMQALMPELKREGRVFPGGMADVVAIAHPRFKVL